MGIWERSIKYAVSSIIIYLGVIYSVYDKYGNRINFQNDGTCEYCSALGNYTPCLARKYTAFSNDKEAAVYHCVLHN